MFWRFGGYANISSIDTILDKPDCTLEEVLDESDVEQELKGQNAKLIEFLRDEAVLSKLLKYVVAPKPVQPAADSRTPAAEEEKTKAVGFFRSRSKIRSKSRGDTEDTFEALEEKWRRYSFVSTQLLSSEVWSIAESLLEYPEGLREFWDYVKTKPELDNMQAGNFSKVNESLLDKKPAEMATFFKTIDGIVDDMIKHVNCPVVMDLLLKIISLEKDSAPGIVDVSFFNGLEYLLKTIREQCQSLTANEPSGYKAKTLYRSSCPLSLQPSRLPYKQRPVIS